MEGGPCTLSFVHVFYGRPSACLWEKRRVHTINQGERGEQGDAMMPLLFSLGQHSGLESTHRRLRANENLFAFLDVYIASKPNRAGASACQSWGVVCPCSHSDPLGQNACVDQHGAEPPVCAALKRAAKSGKPSCTLVEGISADHTHAQGIRVMGAPP